MQIPQIGESSVKLDVINFINVRDVVIVVVIVILIVIIIVMVIVIIILMVIAKVREAVCQGSCHGASCCRVKKTKKKKVGMICEDGTR